MPGQLRGTRSDPVVSIARGSMQLMLIIWLQGIWLPLRHRPPGPIVTMGRRGWLQGWLPRSLVMAVTVPAPVSGHYC
ncbi:MAG: hypothetical protein ACRDRJ_21600 [Streptosporangiaceae bacterium]